MSAKNKTYRIILIILAAVLAGICLLSALCASPFVITAIRLAKERAPAAAVLTEYMQDMKTKDVDAAYDLITPHMQEQGQYEYMRALMEVGNYHLFSDFQRLTVDSLILSNETSTDPSHPQGTAAHVKGQIYYSGGYTGTYVSILEKVDGTWRVYSMGIDAPGKPWR